MQNLKLFNMDSVQAEEVRRLWHPYIPLGKITIIQGDPGEGKQNAEEFTGLIDKYVGVTEPTRGF